MKAPLNFKSGILIRSKDALNPLLQSKLVHIISLSSPCPVLPLSLLHCVALPLSHFLSFSNTHSSALWSSTCSLCVLPLKPAALWNLPLFKWYSQFPKENCVLTSPQWELERSRVATKSTPKERQGPCSFRNATSAWEMWPAVDSGTGLFKDDIFVLITQLYLSCISTRSQILSTQLSCVCLH